MVLGSLFLDRDKVFDVFKDFWSDPINVLNTFDGGEVPVGLSISDDLLGEFLADVREAFQFSLRGSVYIYAPTGICRVGFYSWSR